MVLAILEGGILTAQAKDVSRRTNVLEMDFEDAAVGTTADALGWNIVTEDNVNPTPDAYTAVVKQEGENKLLAVNVNVADGDRKTHDIFIRALDKSYDALTMSYRFRLSETGAVFYLPSLGTKDS